MKRFTETLKWNDQWFRKLKPEIKLLWQWLLDNCDAAGVIEPDMELASFQIGIPMGIERVSELGERVSKLTDTKYRVAKFIQFQYGEISRDCKAHNPVFQSLERHSIPYPIPLVNGIEKVSNESKTGKGQDKDKDKEKEEGCGEEKISSPESNVLAYLNEKSGRNFRHTENNSTFIKSRLAEPGVTVDGVKKMIDRQVSKWKGSDMEDYLRPETLFNKTKFDGYYASKDVPIVPLGQPPPQRQGLVVNLADSL